MVPRFCALEAKVLLKSCWVEAYSPAMDNQDRVLRVASHLNPWKVFVLELKSRYRSPSEKWSPDLQPKINWLDSLLCWWHPSAAAAEIIILPPPPPCFDVLLELTQSLDSSSSCVSTQGHFSLCP